MKYLILGINGMAGHMIATYLLENGHNVTGFARQESNICKTIVGDASDKETLIKLLSVDRYDYVINCIGVLNQFVDAHLADGIFLNSVLPHFLAEELEDTNTKLIHISTDCVFEGTKGQYTESDLPDASSYYGRSKALGEVIDNKNLTIRTSIVGPEIKKNGIGLFHWFMNQTGSIGGYEKVIWSGVTTLQLAKVIAQDIHTPQTGLYHLVNNDVICKYDLLILFRKYCRSDDVAIVPNLNVVCDKSIVNTLEEQPFVVPTYEEMIQEMSQWMKQHKELYSHYFV